MEFTIAAIALLVVFIAVSVVPVLWSRTLGRQGEATTALPRIPQLEPVYAQAEPYRHSLASDHAFFEHRVGIHNPAASTVGAVRVTAIQMNPWPANYDGRHRPGFPFSLPTLQADIDAVAGMSIAPGQTVYWIFGYTASAAFEPTMTAVFSQFAPYGRRGWTGTPWRFEPNQFWRVTYEITSNNQPIPICFSVVVRDANGILHCDLEG
jgi:hypothetical protein